MIILIGLKILKIHSTEKPTQANNETITENTIEESTISESTTELTIY